MLRTLFPCLVLGSFALTACGGVETEPTGTTSGTGGETSTTTGSGGAGTGGTGTGGHASTVDSIAIVPGPDIFCNDSCFMMPAGEERQFAALVLDADGNPVTDVAISWKTGDTTHASVDPTGKVKALKKGTSSLTATADGKTATQDLFITAPVVSKIVVTPPKGTAASPGASVDFDAVAYDLDDKPILDAELSWSVSNDVIATVDGSGVASSSVDGTIVVQVTTDGGGLGSATLVTGSGMPTTTPFSLAQISAGGFHSCGIDATGAAYCWGFNPVGELGDGTTLPPDQNRPTPTPVKGGHTFAKIFAGEYETCALDAAGAGYCWGSQATGTLGNGETADEAITEPTPMVGGHAFAKLAMGGGHACGITLTGALYCWGSNVWNAVGDGTGVDTGTPVEIAKGTIFTDVTAGLYSTCAVRADGHALCWGEDDQGQIGQGGTSGGNHPTPVEVTGGHVFTHLSMYGSFVCGVDDAGAIWCWGRNDTNQIGVPVNYDGITTPTKITSSLTFVDVTAGAFHACGLTAAGEVVCWGDDYYGQLGDGSVTASASPVAVAGNLAFASLDSGPHHTCGLTKTGGAYCWGTSFTGQLGSGFGGSDALFSVIPWPVSSPLP
ncbi:BNR repeat domain protein [Minicystis rosea]|nr:BNR repeat domain protein [Minicystis rosea]